MLIEPGSFRDRKARIFYRDGEVYRLLNGEALKDWEALSATQFFTDRQTRGQIVRTVQVEGDVALTATNHESWAGVLRHDKVPFVSYPYEWPFGMLRDAALLHLDLLLAALQEDLILKDSSSFNIQWLGCAPVFIDIPSFERMEPGTAWAGYRQFCEMFLYPLLLQAYKGVSYRPWLRGSIDGIDAESCLGLMSLRDYLRPGVMKHVVLQAKMKARFADTSIDVKDELKAAGFPVELILANVRQLQKILHHLPQPAGRSQWSEYIDTGHYDVTDQERKETFVREAVGPRRRLVWDLGCNTGLYSRIAAKNSDYVVALDADQMSIERLYQRLAKERCANVLPLVGNLADPTPNLGWRGLERRSLPRRGSPDLVLSLALIHHVVITANIPLREFVEWLADLGADLVIEFVSKQDPMVEKLLRNKADIYTDYEQGSFEKCLRARFEVIKQLELMGGQRVMYFARNPRAPSAD
jgi:SAM-dependent methyltransferase